MTYELAKELKDAGFSQGEPGFNGIVNIIDGKTEPVYFPTLEELIEACGGDLLLVITKEKSTAIHYVGFKEFTMQEFTPIEAVAKLWLALNAHPQTEKSN